MSRDARPLSLASLTPYRAPAAALVVTRPWRSVALFLCEACGDRARVLYEDEPAAARAGAVLGRYCQCCRDNLGYAKAA